MLQNAIEIYITKWYRKIKPWHLSMIDIIKISPLPLSLSLALPLSLSLSLSLYIYIYIYIYIFSSTMGSFASQLFCVVWHARCFEWSKSGWLLCQSDILTNRYCSSKSKRKNFTYIFIYIYIYRLSECSVYKKIFAFMRLW